MNRKPLCLLLAAAVLAPLSALAQAPAAPTPEEIRKVSAYLNDGKDAGPILIDLTPCLTVDVKKGSPTQNDCTAEVQGKVKKGNKVYAWMKWFVPKDGKYEDVTVQWLLDGNVRATQDVSLSIASMGLRHYTAQNAAKEGSWEIKVSRGGKELGSAKFEVE